MILNEAVAELEAQGVELWVEGDALHFRAPKGALTPEMRAYLKENREAVVALLHDRATQIHTVPLSFNQQRIWLVEQMSPGNTALHLPVVAHLRGAVNVAAIEAALVHIIRRQAILRTSFTVADGLPAQNVHPSLSFTMPVIDLREEADPEKEAERLIAEDTMQPFDMSKPSLLRCLLLRLQDDHYVFQIVFHHIVMDGWSMAIFFRELVVFYTALVNNQQPDLPALAWQYTDFVRWQEHFMQSNVLQEQLAFWRKQLADSPPLLSLPTDFPRPAIQTHHGGHLDRNLTPELSAALRHVAQMSRATPYMLLLSAYALLLGRLSGVEDVPIGSPISGRTRAEIEPLCGIFINNLVLRTDLSGNPTFRELLDRIRETALAAYNHQDIPFEKLIEDLHPRRSPSHTPLFQVFFNMLNFHVTPQDMPGMKVELVQSQDTGSNFDVTLYGLERDHVLGFLLVYNTDLFQREHMTHILEQYIALLEQIVADPDRPIGEYSLRLDAVNLPDVTVPLDGGWSEGILERFTANAARSPRQIALADPFGSWSYADLQTRANQLAHGLRAAGIEQGDVVAIYGRRSAALVWAMLGVLKAGAAFMILDPDYPATRLHGYLEAGRPRGIIELMSPTLLPDTLRDAFDALAPAYRVQLPAAIPDDGANPFAGLPSDELAALAGPDDLAYIAFTSGTTGTPKGIAGTLRPVSHFVAWHARNFGLAETDRFSMLSGLAHDPLLRDIFTPLWLGATLCIPDPAIILVPDRLTGWLKDSGVTVMHLTPSLGQIIGSAENATLPALRYAFFGGDALKNRDIQRLRRLAPQTRYVNFYGTTETPQAMGYYVVPEGDADDNGMIVVGQGIDDVQLLVLNSSGGLAGVSEVGEIHIRTPYLTRGYLGDDSLTAERYRTNPATGNPADRLYRTGDLGRYRLDGTVACLGRVDHQVKIRGFRIELGEIEAALDNHPDVEKAVVIVREDQADNKRLVAYVVGGEGKKPESGTLRDYLATRLPDYMVPAAVVALDAFPLTPNNKIDRRALPVPESLEGQTRRTVTEAHTPAEALLVGVWRRVLGVNRVSAVDNFFDLGGHSLQVVQVISELEKETGVRLEPAVMRYQSLRQQAATIEAAGPLQVVHGVGATPEASPIQIQLADRLEEPFFFGAEQSLFGVYYPPADTGQQIGVVVCHPWGQEYIRAHRACHQLALRLSNLGVPALRFDYYGTGDSAGEDEEASIQHSLQSIATAIEELRTRSGVTRIALVGMRLGATLAALAGPQHPAVERVVLWEPLVNGAEYLEELKAWHSRNMLYFLSNIKDSGPKTVTEILGFALSQEMVSEMQAINLLGNTAKPADQVLVIEREKLALTTELCQHLKNGGAAVAYHQVDAPQMWTENPDKALVPHHTLETIVNWMMEG